MLWVRPGSLSSSHGMATFKSHFQNYFPKNTTVLFKKSREFMRTKLVKWLVWILSGLALQMNFEESKVNSGNKYPLVMMEESIITT